MSGTEELRHSEDADAYSEWRRSSALKYIFNFLFKMFNLGLCVFLIYVYLLIYFVKQFK